MCDKGVLKDFLKEIQYPSKQEITIKRLALCYDFCDKSKFFKRYKNYMYNRGYSLNRSIGWTPNKEYYETSVSLKKTLLQCFPIFRIRSNIHIAYHPSEGFLEITEGGLLELEVDILWEKKYCLFDDVHISEKTWDLIRIKRVQRHVKKWLGRITYPSGRKGMVFRKAEKSFNDVLNNI